jgi:hypothetical protein
VSQSGFFRSKAAECDLLAESQSDPGKREAYCELARSWTSLAKRADDLDRDDADSASAPQPERRRVNLLWKDQ